MILTRYLYDKAKVEVSLRSAIIKQEYNQAVFWAYELYYSGFQQEVLDQLQEIYNHLFAKNHPRMGMYIRLKRKQFEKFPELVATIIKNLTMKNPEIHESPKAKFVNVKPHHIEPFMTKEPEVHPWKHLREVCVYGVEGNCSKEEWTEYRTNWIQYTIGSPVWKERVELYEGKMKDVVVFENEDKEEDFHNRFDYEPDEQPLEIQQRCIGILSF
jgi:hypothetical protein